MPKADGMIEIIKAEYLPLLEINKANVCACACVRRARARNPAMRQPNGSSAA